MLPARHGGSYLCKIINACVRNPDRGLPRAYGQIVIFDPETATPVCVMDTIYICAVWAAAVSVAAVRTVRPVDRVRRVTFLLGCGRPARAHLDPLDR